MIGRDGQIEFLFQHVDCLDSDLMQPNGSLQRSQVSFNIASLTIEIHDLSGRQVKVGEKIKPFFRFTTTYPPSDQPTLKRCLRRPGSPQTTVPTAGFPANRVVSLLGDRTTKKLPCSYIG